MDISFINEKFKNKKNGNIYYKLSNVIDCTNGNESVEYALYTEDGSKLYIRKLSEFIEKFEKE